MRPLRKQQDALGDSWEQHTHFFGEKLGCTGGFFFQPLLFLLLFSVPRWHSLRNAADPVSVSKGCPQHWQAHLREQSVSLFHPGNHGPRLLSRRMGRNQKTRLSTSPPASGAAKASQPPGKRRAGHARRQRSGSYRGPGAAGGTGPHRAEAAHLSGAWPAPFLLPEGRPEKTRLWPQRWRARCRRLLCAPRCRPRHAKSDRAAGPAPSATTGFPMGRLHAAAPRLLLLRMRHRPRCCHPRAGRRDSAGYSALLSRRWVAQIHEPTNPSESEEHTGHGQNQSEIPPLRFFVRFFKHFSRRTIFLFALYGFF